MKFLGLFILLLPLSLQAIDVEPEADEWIAECECRQVVTHELVSCVAGAGRTKLQAESQALHSEFCANAHGRNSRKDVAVVKCNFILNNEVVEPVVVNACSE